MVKRSVLAAIVILALVLLAAFYPTETRRVRRLLNNTAAWAEKGSDDSPVVVAARSRKAAKFFSPTIDFAYEKRDSQRKISIEDVERGYLFLMQQRTRFKVKLADIGIVITDSNSAAAEATVLIESEGAGQEGLSNVNDVAFDLRKGEDGWRISGIRIREVLDK